jgi:hypothetical protein
MDISDDRISAYLDDELPADERAAVEAWLAERPEQRQLLAELASLRSDLQSLPQRSLGDDFSQRVVATAVARQAGAHQAVAPASQARTRRRMNSALVAIPALAGAAIVAALLINRPWQKNDVERPIAVAPVEGSSHELLNPAIAELRQAIPQPGEALVVRVRVSQATLMSHGLDAALAKSGIKLGPADRAALANGVGNAYRQKLRETHLPDQLAATASDAIFINAPLAQIETLLIELGKEPAANLAIRPEMLVRALPLAPHDVAEAEADAEGESGSAGMGTKVQGPTAQRLNAGMFRLPAEAAASQRIESPARESTGVSPDVQRSIQVLLILEAAE